MLSKAEEKWLWSVISVDRFLSNTESFQMLLSSPLLLQFSLLCAALLLAALEKVTFLEVFRMLVRFLKTSMYEII